MKTQILCIIMTVIMCLSGCSTVMDHSTAPTVAPTTVPTTAFDIEREYPWYRKLDFNQLSVHESITCQQDVVDEISALMQMSVADGYLRIHVSTNTPYVDPEIYSVIDYFEMTEVPTILYVKHECIDIEKLAELAKEPVVSRISILLPIYVVPE